MFWFQIISVKGNTVLVNEQRDVFGLKRLHLHLPGVRCHKHLRVHFSMFQNVLKTLKDCKSAPTCSHKPWSAYAFAASARQSRCPFFMSFYFVGAHHCQALPRVANRSESLSVFWLCFAWTFKKALFPAGMRGLRLRSTLLGSCSTQVAFCEVVVWFRSAQCLKALEAGLNPWRSFCA